MNRKQIQRQAIRSRAQEALEDLYHNSTPSWPSSADDRFFAWLGEEASLEIDYINDGGANGKNPRKIFEHPANAGKYKSQAARRFYVKHNLRKLEEERADCGIMTGWRWLEIKAGNPETVALLAQYPGAERNNALWERISEYGNLCQYGRGGRTLAPTHLVSSYCGAGFGIKTDAHEDFSIADTVDMIRIIESFNAYVKAWNRGLPKIWAEHCANFNAEAQHEANEAAH